jgi:alanine racemase
MRLTREKLLKIERGEGGKSEESQATERVRARVRLKAIEQNYRAICELQGEGFCLPMIKADGYGHGAIPIARRLVGDPNLFGFGVATFDEGVQLRKGLESSRDPGIRILVASHAAPWTEEKAQLCLRHRLTPVFSTEEDLRKFLKSEFAKSVEFHLKFNTGMNRLGIPFELHSRIGKLLESSAVTPEGIWSHLASGDEPQSAWTQRAVRKFRELGMWARGSFPRASLSLLASSGIWNWKSLRSEIGQFSDLVRPGLSLYGVPPWRAAPEHGISRVLSLEVRVAQVHALTRGERVGYGGVYRVEEEQEVATLQAGYADGVLRALGATNDRASGAWVWGGGRFRKILGRVSMDLMSVEGDGLRAGDWVEVLSPKVDLWDQAVQAGSIPYELFTGLSSRVKRIYVD